MSSIRYFIDTVWRGGQPVARAKSALSGLKDVGGKVTGQIKGLDLSLTDLKSGMDIMGQSLSSIGGLFKRTFDLAAEGKSIKSTRDRLDSLAKTIGTTGDEMLSRLRTATRGGVDDLTLMTSAITFLNMRFVDSQEGAEQLIQKILLLKSPTEDTAAAIENFSLMLANQSLPRLDSFGLSAGRVRTRINELMEANEGLSREQAFVTATMEEMDVAVARQGLQVDDLGNDYNKLAAKIDNARGSFAEFLNQQWQPIIWGLNMSIEESDRIWAKMNESVISINESLGPVLTKISRIMPMFRGTFGVATTLLDLHQSSWETYRDAVILTDEALARMQATVESSDRVLLKQLGTVDALETRMMVLANATDSYREASLDYELTAEQMAAAEGRRIERLHELEAVELARLERAQNLIISTTQMNDVESRTTDILLESAAAAGADTEAMIALAFARGELTLAEADALTKTILLEEAIRALGKQYGEGKLSADELKGAVRQATDEINSMPDSKTIKFFFDMPPIPDLFGAPSVTTGPGGSGIPMAAGGAFTVPPGFPNDTFGPVWLTSGEHVSVTPAGQNPGNRIYIESITIDARGSVAGVGQEIRQEMEMLFVDLMKRYGRTAQRRVRMA